MKNQREEPLKDIRVVMNFKNNLIMALMEKAGYKTVADLSRATDIPQTELGLFINMKRLPTLKDGEWRPAIVKLADFFKCLPGDLFSEFQQENVLEKNRTHAEVHYGEIQAMLAVQNAGLLDPVVSSEKTEMRTILEQAISTLSPLHQRVLRARFGLGGPEMTLEEVGKSMDLTKERVRQIEAKALRHMRHPSRSDRLRDFVGDDG